MCTCVGVHSPESTDSVAATTYLDHAGTTLYASSLIKSFAEDLQLNLFGNPHSASPSSHLSSVRVDHARELVLKYFNADPACFDVIFTANATAAIKLVREAFVNYRHGYVYGYHRDCHTSIVGMRESAKNVRYLDSDDEVETWINTGATLDNSVPSDASPLQLFAYPAQSNLSGHRCPQSWSGDIRAVNVASTRQRRQIRKVYTLLDAASYLTSGRLFLRDPATAPDYACMSFYKIFGFPDLGALIVNKTTGAANVLADLRLMDNQRQGRYYGGGTVDMIINSTQKEDAWFAMRNVSVPAHNTSTSRSSDQPMCGDIHEIFEDGTLPFHSIVALEHAFKVHAQLFSDGRRVRQHTARLIKRAYDELDSLRHANGRKVVEVYADAYARTFTDEYGYRSERYVPAFGDPSRQGPILAFNILDAQGQNIGKSEVERAAIAAGFQLRTGGVCNPGGIACHLDLKPWEMRRNFAEGMRCGDDLDVLGGKATGIVRISLGPMSCMKDVMRFCEWVRWLYVEESSSGWSLGGDLRFDVGEAGGERRVVRKLEAIEGMEVDVLRRSKDIGASYDAVMIWEREWLILSTDTQQPLDSRALRRAGLRGQLLPEDGVLRLATGVSIDKSGRGLHIDISLWDSPALRSCPDNTCHLDLRPASIADSSISLPYNTMSTQSSNHRQADPYSDPKIKSFLSAVVGVPCTLARYRSRLLNKTSNDKRIWKCVKAGCMEVFLTETDLLYHYKAHALEFELNLQHGRQSVTTITTTPVLPEHSRLRSSSNASTTNTLNSIATGIDAKSITSASTTDPPLKTPLRIQTGFYDTSVPEWGVNSFLDPRKSPTPAQTKFNTRGGDAVTMSVQQEREELARRKKGMFYGLANASHSFKNLLRAREKGAGTAAKATPWEPQRAIPSMTNTGAERSRNRFNEEYGTPTPTQQSIRLEWATQDEPRNNWHTQEKLRAEWPAEQEKSRTDWFEMPYTPTMGGRVGVKYLGEQKREDELRRKEGLLQQSQIAGDGKKSRKRLLGLGPRRAVTAH